MSSRPKRKATNRAYNDTIDESLFEEQQTSKNLKKRSKDSSPSTTGSSSQNSQSLSSSLSSTPASQTSSKPELPYNWQPLPGPNDYFSHKLNLKAAFIDLATQTLYCPSTSQVCASSSAASKSVKRRKSSLRDCFKISKNDFIYMVSEPPGEPYYIGSVMGFTPKERANVKGSPELRNPAESETTPESFIQSDGTVDAANYVFKIQWYYRPRDISKSTSDSRLLYASMHTDTCPLLSFRGLVTVRHKGDIEAGLVEIPSKPCGHLGVPVSASSGPTASKSASPAPLAPLEAYSQIDNCFYFDKLFDRYMIKFYDIILTKHLLHESQRRNNEKNLNFLKALNKRFEFIFVEGTMTKAFVNSFASSLCNCEKCGQWCSNQDSVTCITCDNHYHMYCLDPPLLKKPSRGFSWSCAPCTKKHDLEHQKKKMIMLSHDNKLSNELQLTNELSSIVDVNVKNESSDQDVSDSQEDAMDIDEGTPLSNGLPKFESMAIEFLERDANYTFEERRVKEEWSMRYLGLHSRLEDGVDLEDRSPYPRALTRLGAKHQALNLPEYEGHEIVYYDTERTLSGEYGNRKKAGKKTLVKQKKALGEETQDPAIVKMDIPKEFVDVEPEDYPDWLQPRPKGYIERGVDDGEGRTCTLLYKSSQEDIDDDFAKLGEYVEKCYPVAEKKLALIPTTPNFMDAILKTYMENKGDVTKSLEIVNTFTRAGLGEPTFSKEEIKKFEEGVRKYGSELYPTFKEVKTQSCSMIVRFYYLWKKTANGRAIWGNFEGRLQKKLQNIKDEELKQHNQQFQKQHKPEIDLLASVDDDSSYEGSKIELQKQIMTCKHCLTTQSIFWHRITGFDANTDSLKALSIDENIDKKSKVALCFRCAKMWRRYAVVWEDPQEVKKKNTRGAGGWKKKVEYELVRDSENILSEAEKYGGLSYNISRSPENSIVDLLSLETAPESANIEPASKPTTSNNKKVANNQKTLSATKVDDSKKKKPAPKVESIKKEPQTPIKPRGKPGPKPKVKDSLAVAEGSKKSSVSKSSSVKIEGRASSSKATTVSLTPKSSKTSASKSNSKTDEPKSSVKRKREIIPKTDRKKPGPKPKIKVTETEIKNQENDDGDIQELIVPPPKKARKNPTSKNTQKQLTLSFKVEDVNDGSSDDILKKRNTVIIDPNYNKNYIKPTLKNKSEKKTTNMNKETLENTITQFRPRQLLDVKSQLPIFQVSAGTLIDTPFLPSERNCSFCQEQDLNQSSLDEMLICSNCGVNVHASCVGLSIPSSLERPVKEWLCEPCVNDLNPHHSTLYSCSLCLANESNYEFVILGSDKVKADFLKPIYDSGKWCHLLCALLNYENASFKSVGRRTFKWESNLMNISNNCSIESVSEIYLQSYDKKCGICHSGNGSLISCSLCEEDEIEYYFHPTCAQDTPRFKIGLKLDPIVNSNKDAKLVEVDGKVGKLRPALVCEKHSLQNIEDKLVFNFRKKGVRVQSNGDEKPLIQFLIEDISKKQDQNYKLSGPQAMASNYIKLSTLYDEREKKRLEKTYFRVLQKQHKTKTRTKCKRCQVTVSPMWWPIAEKDSKDTNVVEDSEQLKDDTTNVNRSVHCQSCHHEIEERDVREDSISPPPVQSSSLFQLINQPLNGESFGLKNNADRLIV